LWEQRYNNFIELLEEQSRAKRPRLSIGVKQIVDRSYREIRKFERYCTRTCFVQVSAGYSSGLRWRDIDTAFKSRILTSAVISSRYIEPRQFLEDAREIVLERVQRLQKHNSIVLR